MPESAGMAQPKRALSAAEKLDWLRLIRTENIGPITFRNLLARFGAAGPALEALPDLSRRGGRTRPLRPVSKAEAERELAALRKLGADLIALVEPGYPPLLTEIEDPPPLLSLLGHAHLLTRPMLAVVGARNASTNGRHIAGKLAAEAGQAGYTVVSGMARGIDAAAHEGALATGTVAVLAGGVDVVYPPENRPIYDKLLAEGAVIAEMPPGTQPQARHFPRRNRLISGLAFGVLVVEAAPRSGSLITARLAAEQGREVFAVPGSPLDPRAQGCNGLIRKGATLVEKADDIVEGLSGMTRAPLGEAQLDLFAAPATPLRDADVTDADRSLVLENLSPTPTPIDELIRQCELSPAVVRTVLLELELARRVEHQPGNRVSLI